MVDTVFNENEAFWAGLGVAAAMLGSGFSLLLFPTFMGYGAVILSLGIMTMTLVLMTKTLIIQIQKWMDYNARIEETVANILALRQQVSAVKAVEAEEKNHEIEKPEAEVREEAEIAAS